jgi:hypothetical protein
MKKGSFFKKSDLQVLNPPSFVDHSANIPPVGDQGQIGSCVGWATGYYYKTYQEYEDYGWSVFDRHNIFSPSFVYNHINGGADYGADFDDAFKLLVDNGCANINDFPYTANITLWPSESIYLDAIKYRSQDAYYIDASNQSGINQLRQYISDGHCAVLGIAVYPNFDNIQSFGYVYCSSDVYGSSRGNHAVTIVGYDDNKQTHDGMGAFKLINSWGASWGMTGFFWMSYTAVMDYVISGRVGYYSTPKNHYNPGLIARVKCTGNSRGEIRIKLGIKNSGTELWSKEFFNFNMGINANVPFPANNIVFDMTDGINYIDSSQTRTLFLACTDIVPQNNNTAVITNFSSTNINWGLTSVSTQTPKNIPNTGEEVSVSLGMGPNLASNVGVYSIDLQNNITMGNMIPKITVRNFGTAAQSFPVSVKIYNASNSSLLYTGNSNVTNLPPANNIQVSFSNFNAPAGNLKVVGITSLASDTARNNDTLIKFISVYPQAQVPVLISPSNGANGLLTSVQLYWSKSTGANNYCLQVSPDSLFSTFVYRDSLLTDTTKMVYSLNILSKYFWRVKAMNPANSSTFSSVYNFKTMGLPNVVTLASPINNSQFLTLPVTFKWNKPFEITSIKLPGKGGTDVINKYLIEFTLDTSSLYGYIAKAADDTLLIIDSLNGSSLYYWRVSARNEMGWGQKSVWWKFSTANVGINRLSSEVPAEYKLFNNYPNPFNPSTNIKFSIPLLSSPHAQIGNPLIVLKVYDILGKEIATLVNEKLQPGTYEVPFSINQFPNYPAASGIYFYRFITDKYTATKRMILIK